MVKFKPYIALMLGLGKLVAAAARLGDVVCTLQPRPKPAQAEPYHRAQAGTQCLTMVSILLLKCFIDSSK